MMRNEIYVSFGFGLRSTVVLPVAVGEALLPPHTSVVVRFLQVPTRTDASLALLTQMRVPPWLKPL